MEVKLEKIKDFIFTFEVKFDVKDIDLEKEVESWMRDNTDSAGFFDTTEFARYFVSLGVAMEWRRNKEQKGE